MTEAPAQPPIPSDGTDDLGTAVLQGLSRPIGRKQTPRLLRTFVVGIASFGLIPVIRWSTRFRQFVTLEQQQFWHLAEWLRLHTRSAAAEGLRDDANRIRFRPALAWLSVLSVLVVIVTTLRQLYLVRITWAHLIQSTYLYPWLHQRLHLPSKLMEPVYVTWCAGLAVAYVAHWLQVRLHAGDRARFIRRFNAVVSNESLTPVTPAPLGIGLSLTWFFAGLVLAVCGGFWGIPMMLAGALHRRTIRDASLADRQSFARRVHAMLQSRRLGEPIPLPVYLRRLCQQEFCRSPLRDWANFCPRCGTRAAAPMHRVA